MRNGIEIRVRILDYENPTDGDPPEYNTFTHMTGYDLERMDDDTLEDAIAQRAQVTARQFLEERDSPGPHPGLKVTYVAMDGVAHRAVVTDVRGDDGNVDLALVDDGGSDPVVQNVPPSSPSLEADGPCWYDGWSEPRRVDG